jgi:hypothetical protein
MPPKRRIGIDRKQVNVPSIAVRILYFEGWHRLPPRNPALPTDFD